jgi:hypothetical protein
MEQIVYTVAANRGGHAGSFNSAEYLRLIQARLSGFEALAQSLIGCRKAFIECDLDSILKCVEQQSSHCNEIIRTEQVLASHASESTQITEFLSPSEVERAKELQRRTTEIKNAVQQLNCIYAGLVRKASQNNAVLRNLYATALVYADPRLGSHESYGRTEE